MDCRDIEERIANALPGAMPPDVASHVARCADCAEAAEAASEGLAALRDLVAAERRDPAPPTDVEAVLAAATAARPRPRVFRTVLRAAAVLLAAIGVLSLMNTRVTAHAGDVSIAFSVPGLGAPDAPAPQEPSDLEHGRDLKHPSELGPPEIRAALHEELTPIFERLTQVLTVRDRQYVADLETFATLLADRRREDTRALAFEIADVRDQLNETRRLLVGPMNGPPEIPDLR